MATKPAKASKAVSVSDLADLLAAAKTGYIAEILAEEESKALATEKRGSNVGTRKAALVAALIKATKKVKGCTEDLAPAAEAVKRLVPESKVVAPIAEAVVQEQRELTPEEAVLVAKQIIDGKAVKELVDATYDAAKQAVFTTLNVVFAEEGEAYPEHTNGYLDVPELGKRLCREGAGRKEATLDEERLREIVGEDVWVEITTAHVVRTVDEDKLAQAVLADPDLLERVREATETGGWKSPRLTVRDIPAEDAE